MRLPLAGTTECAAAPGPATIRRVDATTPPNIRFTQRGTVAAVGSQSEVCDAGDDSHGSGNPVGPLARSGRRPSPQRRRRTGQSRFCKERRQGKAAPRTRPQTVYAGKLGLSQSLLEGLVLEDFDKIGKAAESLSALSQAEQWRISNDALYKQHSAEFLRAAKQLTKGAKDSNLDAASLGFVKLTMSCVECHRYVRNELVADSPPAKAD